MNERKIIGYLKNVVLNRIWFLLRWLLFAGVTGVVLGLIGTAFGKGIASVTAFRKAHDWVLYTLPLLGLVIVWLYQWEKDQKSSTNLVLDAIHSQKEIPVKTAPLIFASTVLTHLGGGSAGREGAALQLGGSIGNFLGKCFRFDENDKRVMIMCGMSAAFAALFGTPLASTVFSMEVISVGIMHYAALVPCAAASFVAAAVAKHFGMEAECFPLAQIPELTLTTGAKVLVLGVLCAFVSILFCVVLHRTEELFHSSFKNPYLRAVVSAGLIILLTKLLGTTDYLGAGMDIAGRAVEEGRAVPYAFLLKMLFTAITLAGGFKGGEIVPTFFVGATFGALAGSLLHFDPSLAAACGMAAVFCGVTNSPISSLFFSFELFGFAGAPYFLLVIAVSYMQSGYYGLYHSQRIVYSKTRTEYINQNTKK